jgi:hypothetical protein
MKPFITRNICLLIVSFWFYNLSISDDNILFSRRYDSVVLKQMLLNSNEEMKNAEIEALAWHTVFSDKYKPTEGMRYTFISGKSGDDIDILRMRYTVGNEIITITQSICLCCIEINLIDNKLEEKEKVLEAENVARRIFKNGKGIVLKTMNVDVMKRGTVDQKYDLPDFPWYNTLHWWQKNDSVGFIFTKIEGRNSSTSPAPTLDCNIFWFSESGRKRSMENFLKSCEVPVDKNKGIEKTQNKK